MKYFLIAGEASGDIHASALIRALRECDPDAEFRFFGGDLMRDAAAAEPIVHYRNMAYMGFIEVARHLREILAFLTTAKQSIDSFQPDAVILIDYPSFNLKVARFAHKRGIPVFYYISPKVWAWKEHRIKSLRRYVTRLYSILPFEKGYFLRHGYDTTYTGNPSVKEVDEALASMPSRSEFLAKHGIAENRRIIAILPGSRRKEIACNLPEMLKATLMFPEYQPVIAGAPAIDTNLYTKIIKTEGSYAVPPIVHNDTFALLRYSEAALVTSGTATLETALIGTPQIACYRMNGNPLLFAILSKILHVKYVTLPNLIVNAPVIPELLLHNCTAKRIATTLRPLLAHSPQRDAMLDGYSRMREILGTSDSPAVAAADIVSTLTHKSTINPQ